MAEYKMTCVAQSVNAVDVIGPVDLGNGFDLDFDGSRIVLDVVIEAKDARTALVNGRAVMRDLLYALGASYAAYRLDPDDARDYITRVSAVEVFDGELPPLDVAEGFVSEAGVEWLDPDGDLRRAGKVIRLRAKARGQHPSAEDSRRFEARDFWTPRLRAALALYWEGQCASDEYVRFVLSMSALELLVAPSTESLLASRLPAGDRASLVRDIRSLLSRRGLTPEEATRVVDRAADTRAEGSARGIAAYLAANAPDEFAHGAITIKRVSAWQKTRGGYLHDGRVRDDELDECRVLTNMVGACLRSEMDRLVTAEPSRLAPATESGTATRDVFAEDAEPAHHLPED